MNEWIQFLAVERRLEELRQLGERERLARQVPRDVARHYRYDYRALRWLGGRLVSWGGRLEQRFAAVAATPEPALGESRCTA
jgi:hypothetical protein